MSMAFRPLRAEDGPQVLAWRNAPHVAAHMYTDHAVGEAEHARWLEATLAAEDRRYWIILTDERPVGLASLVQIDRHNRRCEWGFYLGEPEARGAGVGMAALYLLMRQAFDGLRLHRLTAGALAENEAAAALYESMGFTCEGRLRQHIRKGGRDHDVLAYAMLAPDWPAARAQVEARLRAKDRDPARLAVRAA